MDFYGYRDTGAGEGTEEEEGEEEEEGKGDEAEEAKEDGRKRGSAEQAGMSSEGLMDRLLALVGVGVDTLVEDVLLLLPPADLRAARQVRVEMLLFPSTSCTSSARSVRP